MNNGLVDWQMAGLVGVFGLDCVDGAGREGLVEQAKSYHLVISSSSSSSSR